MKKILIYESSSRGGNYNYALALFKTYRENGKFTDVKLMLPGNSPYPEQQGVYLLLLSDRIYKQKWLNRLSFFIRMFFNPFILFFYLVGKPKTLVLFNDFEQLSAPVWAPLFRLFLTRHRYSIFLHDPDRDSYLSGPRYSAFSMTELMRMMDMALYHDHLPEKPYYRNRKTTFLSVPHGLYPLPLPRVPLLQSINEFKGKAFLFALLGNIRKEKNYEFAIRALKSIAGARLVIAGNPANTDIDLRVFKAEAEKHGVSERILWCIRYLEEDELAAVITASDCILLNYAATFTSQSGIVNMVAPFRKKIIVSETESSLTNTVKRFNLGITIQADSEQALVAGMIRAMANADNKHDEWDAFFRFASWENQINLVAEAYEKL